MGVTRIPGIGENATWDKTTNNITQHVKFNVGITVEGKETAGAKIGVVSSILNLGANAETEKSNQSINQIMLGCMSRDQHPITTATDRARPIPQKMKSFYKKVLRDVFAVIHARE